MHVLFSEGRDLRKSHHPRKLKDSKQQQQQQIKDQRSKSVGAVCLRSRRIVTTLAAHGRRPIVHRAIQLR